MFLNLSNGKIFNFDLDSKRSIYFGPNSVGKTTITKGINDYFTESNQGVITFQLESFTKLIDHSDNCIQIQPSILDINKLDNEKKLISEKYNIKNTIKDLTGLTKQSDFNDYTASLKLFKDDGPSLIKSNYSEIYNMDTIKIIFSKENDRNNFFELMDKIEEIFDFDKGFTIDNIKFSEFSNEIKCVQKYILDSNLERCPVCNGEIDEDRKKFISNDVLQKYFDINNNNALIFYRNNPTTNSILETLLNKLSISRQEYNSEFKRLKINLDNSICFNALKNVDNQDNEKYIDDDCKLKNIAEDNKNITIVPKKNLKKSVIIQKFEDKLALHPAFKNIKTDYKNKKIIFSSNERNLNNLSTSEKNYFILIYYSILIESKITKSRDKINVIIDDPIDSYDDANIDFIFKVIAKMIFESDEFIDHAIIFSHKYEIFKLANTYPLNSKDKPIKFNCYWVDESLKNNNLLVYNDCSSCKNYDSKISDLFLLEEIKNKTSDKYAALTYLILLRNFLYDFKGILNPSCNCYKITKQITNNISNSVEHTSRVSFPNVFIKDNDYYDFNSMKKHNSINMDTIMDDFFKNKIDKFKIDGVGSSNVINLLCYKFLYGNFIRRKLDYILRKKLHIKFTSIGDGISIIKNDYDKYKSLIGFYDNYENFLNSFGHSSTRSLSPIFIYKLSYIELCFDSLEAIENQLNNPS